MRSRSDFLRPLAFSLGKKTRHAMEVGATRGSHLASQGGLCLWVSGEFALQSHKKHLAWLGLPCLGLALRLLNCSALQLLHLSCRGRARGKPQTQYLQRERESLCGGRRVRLSLDHCVFPHLGLFYYSHVYRVINFITGSACVTPSLPGGGHYKRLKQRTRCRHGAFSFWAYVARRTKAEVVLQLLLLLWAAQVAY